jgi:Arc/MetJ-type ribon-helix-helix transcriptional regulator
MRMTKAQAREIDDAVECGDYLNRLEVIHDLMARGKIIEDPRLRAELAAETRDRAQWDYDELAPRGERLLQVIAEHRAKAVALANAADDDQYAARLTAQAQLECEIAELRS